MRNFTQPWRLVPVVPHDLSSWGGSRALGWRGAPWCSRKAAPWIAQGFPGSPGICGGQQRGRVPVMAGIDFLQMKGWSRGYGEGLKIILNEIQKVVFLAQRKIGSKIHTHH